MKYFQVVTLSLILSLFFHLALISGLIYLPKPQPADVVSFEILQAPSKPARQLTLQTTVPQYLKEDNDKMAQYLSARRQRVKQQLKARRSGLSKNRSGKGTKQVQKQKKKDDFGKGPVLPSHAYLSQGSSTLNELLPPDVKAANLTALNTDQHTHYSFYARIIPQIRSQWVQAIRGAMGYYQRHQLESQKTTWTTQAEAVLDKNGYLKKVLIFRSSGAKQFDAATKFAFLKSTPYLNPPKGMVQDDGHIRLRFNFSLQWSPKQLARKF